MNNFFSKIKYLDITVAVICFLLLLVGLSLIYSTSLNGSKAIFYHQIIYSLIAIGLFLFFAFFDYRTLTKQSRYYYLLFVALLGGLILVGRAVQGSSRWFNLGVINLQPAELMKLIMVLVLARFFALRRGEINTFKNVSLSFLYVLIPMLLIAKQPDLGSAIVIFVIWLGMLFFSTVNKKVFIYLFIALALFSGVAWKTLLHDYQKNRIEIFLNPDRDPKGKGYNVRQATIAIGSGGVFGRGLGKGLQSQLRFLPERQTDFIFASASEELGFLGSMVIITLYFILLFRLLIIYRQCRDDLSRFLIIGIFFMMLSQVVINVGMNMGIMPVTGIPLPMLSYGGSSLLTVAISMGIAEAVAINARGIRL
ncbi:MAG: rod shape-determining protein rodA [Candidatus Doudnabacteria bacterium]|nr:rod shape-determining protein rodA [Candidatus Doudnabacteria bacterium]